MIFVSIESPFRPSVPHTNPEYRVQMQKNIEFARQCMADSIRQGEVPFASHLLFPQILEDYLPEEREKGLELAHMWISRCDLVALYIDHGISEGMTRAMRRAEALEIPFVTRRLYVA